MTTQRTTTMNSAGTVTAGRGAASRTWRKISATIREMNYAAGRVASPRVPARPARGGTCPDTVA